MPRRRYPTDRLTRDGRAIEDWPGPPGPTSKRKHKRDMSDLQLSEKIQTADWKTQKHVPAID